MLNDIEKLKAAQIHSLNEAVEENRIYELLPVQPKRVGFGLTSMPWVTYEVKTLAEALDIFRNYEPLPWVIAENGSFTVVDTWASIEKKHNTRKGVPVTHGAYTERHAIPEGAPYFDCQQGEGFATNEMEFFTHAAGVDLKICIRIEQCPIRVHLVPLSPYTGHRGQKEFRKDYPNVPGASILKWGYGDTCCKGTYWFPDLNTFWASMGTYVPVEGLPE